MVQERLQALIEERKKIVDEQGLAPTKTTANGTEVDYHHHYHYFEENSV